MSPQRTLQEIRDLLADPESVPMERRTVDQTRDWLVRFYGILIGVIVAAYLLALLYALLTGKTVVPEGIQTSFYAIIGMVMTAISTFVVGSMASRRMRRESEKTRETVIEAHEATTERLKNGTGDALAAKLNDQLDVDKIAQRVVELLQEQRREGQS